MILTHGSNSLGVGGNQNYILDNFVALYNGVTDSGYAINDGSFGQLLWDANGPIQSPNGQGTPYYARANFSGQNGGVMAIYDGLKSVFSDGIFTADYYVKVPTRLSENDYLFAAYNADRSNSIVINKQLASTDGMVLEAYLNESTYSSTNRIVGSPLKHWTHVALVGDGTNLRVYCNGILNGTLSFSIMPTIPSDINTLRFRFFGNAGGICIAQFALRDYAVWTSNFTPPTLLYKQI